MREEVRIEKEWGYEIWIENNELYCLKLLVCEDYIWTSKGKYHYHPVKDETFFILDGILELDIEGKTQYFAEGNSIRIKPGVKHRFRSSTHSCSFIEASTTHREEDSIRVEEL